MRTFLKVWVGIGLIAIGFGIGLLVLAFASGAHVSDTPTYSMNETYEDAKNLDFEIGYGEVNIVEGNTFSIDAENMVNDGFESYVTDGTWYIKENYDNMVDIFGWRFSLRQVINWHDNYSPKITITLPKGFIADTIKFKTGAGEVTAQAINAISGDFEVDAGMLKIDQITIEDDSQYNVGAGNMVLENATINDTTIECGLGQIVIDGTITGDNDITCGIGNIDLSLDGQEKDYSYEISADIGNVTINDRNYHHESINNNSDNNLYLDCGIGHIGVDFR